MAKEKTGGSTPAQSGIFAWWGGDGALREAFDGQSERWRTFFAELRSTYGDGWRAQLELVSANNERMAQSVQAYARCRKPEDLVAAGSDLMMAMLESASAQSRHMVDLGGKVGDCCAGLATGAAETARAPAAARAAAKEEARA